MTKCTAHVKFVNIAYVFLSNNQLIFLNENLHKYENIDFLSIIIIYKKHNKYMY